MRRSSNRPPRRSPDVRRIPPWRSISMPTPAAAQAIMAPRPPVARPKAAGRAKMPEPTIELTTRAMSARSESFGSAGEFTPHFSAAGWALIGAESPDCSGCPKPPRPRRMSLAYRPVIYRLPMMRGCAGRSAINTGYGGGKDRHVSGVFVTSGCCSFCRADY